ncbi:STAS-like domain-containing protein [Rubritalea sp.]|uniref:STAS-like domain-containing protein n=1 Tax=Rubritalea sp. TaxID=2109375 RepID=UPI003EF5817F
MTQEVKKLKISNFSKYPGGRIPSEGPFSGEEYREKFFEPALNTSDVVEVNMCGLSILLPSFVDEAFGPACARLGEQKFRERVKFKYPYQNSEAEFFVEQTIRQRLGKK